MGLQQFEDEIIQSFQHNIPELQVEGFPEIPEDYKLLHPVGALLVVYAGSKFSESPVEGYIRQEQRLEFDCVIIMKKLRGGGIYDMLDKIRAQITGMNVSGNKAYPLREQFLRQKAGLWQYGITLAFKTINQES